jgi:hypothetical protein
VTDSNDQDYQLLILNFVDHPVIADSDAAQTVKLALEHTPRRWVDSQLIDCGDNALTIFPAYFCECLRSALLDANQVSHALPAPNPKRDPPDHATPELLEKYPRSPQGNTQQPGEPHRHAFGEAGMPRYQEMRPTRLVVLQ